MRAQPDAQSAGRNAGRAAKIALLVCLVGGGAWIVTISPFVAVENVVVATPDRATASYIRSYINLPPHISTLTYPLSWVADATAKCPVVRTAVAKRRPMHTILVIPELRTPMCALSAETGYLVIDDEGVVFRALAERPAGLALVEGFHPAPTQVGERIHPWYAQLLGPCLRSARDSGLKGGLSVDMANRHLVTLTTANGVLCKLGGPEDLPLKVNLCSDILSSIAKSGYRAEYVDVRVPERPVWKPKGAVPPSDATTAKAGKAAPNSSPHKPAPSTKPQKSNAKSGKQAPAANEPQDN